MYEVKHPLIVKAAKLLTEYSLKNENPTNAEKFDVYKHFLAYCESSDVDEKELIDICEEYSNRLK